ncbi:MAG: S-adenosylmethionine:tRNA ribosyltransferase-isomerase, partial [Fibrobacter sp.]|nr:S-adenosylmethionine:tRNA ribosyltransferase-isomerase [Fibrobacter sp.]
MRLEQFDYDLPQELIAQVPCEPRDRCKLIYVEKNTS